MPPCCAPAFLAALRHRVSGLCVEWLGNFRVRASKVRSWPFRFQRAVGLPVEHPIAYMLCTFPAVLPMGLVYMREKCVPASPASQTCQLEQTFWGKHQVLVRTGHDVPSLKHNRPRAQPILSQIGVGKKGGWVGRVLCREVAAICSEVGGLTCGVAQSSRRLHN